MTIVGGLISFFLLSCSYRKGHLVAQIEGFYGYSLPVFSIFLFLSYVVAHYCFQEAIKQENWPKNLAEIFLFLAVTLGLVGAKFFFMLESYEEWWGKTSWWQYLTSPGGMTWYGGLLLASGGIVVAARWFKIPLGLLADNFMLPIALGYAIGRLGCLFSGDGCYGIACPDYIPEPWCMSFPNGVASWSEMIQRYGNPHLRVYNTPLFEALFSLISGVTLWLYYRQKRGNGLLLLRYIFLHALFRFFIEFIRLNPRNVFGLSQAQFISLLLLAMSSGLFWWLKKNRGIAPVHDSGNIKAGLDGTLGKDPQ